MKFSRLLKSSIGIAMMAGALLLAPTDAKAQVGVTVAVAPPAIPVYTQPVAPGDGYIWTPGYWAWNGDGYVWVDGAWVLAPYTGALWTPGYWGYGGAGYFWNAGYWGPTVGYYGGINYGFGYFGIGFYGGYWGGGRFWYNSCYSRVGYGFHNVYNRPYNGYSGRPGGASFTRASYNGGRGSSFGGGRFSTVNGQNFNNNHGQSFNNNRGSSFAQGQSRSNYGGFGNTARQQSPANYSAARSYNGSNGGSNYAPRTYTPSYNSPGRSYASAAPYAGAPHANNYSVGNNAGAFRGGSMSSGGSSFHGGGMSGGGGSFHGGGMSGGGGSFHGGGGGGGGSFHGGGGGGGGSHGGGGGGGHR